MLTFYWDNFCKTALIKHGVRGKNYNLVLYCVSFGMRGGSIKTQYVPPFSL